MPPPTSVLTRPIHLSEIIGGLKSPDTPQLEAPDYPKFSERKIHVGVDHTPANLGLTTGANRHHTTDEAHQLFLGVEHAGYKLAGYDTPDPELNVRILLDRYSPGTVLVQDEREWRCLTAGGSYGQPDMSFRNVSSLRGSGAFVGTVLKDAQNNPEFHRHSAEAVAAHFWVCYYSPAVVHHLAPYTRLQHLVRTYHTVDKSVVPPYSPRGRAGSILSGAVSGAYPLRTALVRNLKDLPQTLYLKHPGYHRNGCHTPEFLRTLSNFKVSICTASRYGYALRKIMESTACGCVVVTDLPVEDKLPWIDDNLVRVHPDIQIKDMAALLRDLCERYDPDRQEAFARVATDYYDYRATGVRLANDIERLRVSYNADAV